MMPGTKDYVSLGKKVHKQKQLLLCNSNELYTAFKEKHPNSKMDSLSFVAFDLSGVLLSQHQALIPFAFAPHTKKLS